MTIALYPIADERQVVTFDGGHHPYRQEQKTYPGQVIFLLPTLQDIGDHRVQPMVINQEARDAMYPGGSDAPAPRGWGNRPFLLHPASPSARTGENSIGYITSRSLRPIDQDLFWYAMFHVPEDGEILHPVITTRPSNESAPRGWRPRHSSDLEPASHMLWDGKQWAKKPGSPPPGLPNTVVRVPMGNWARHNGGEQPEDAEKVCDVILRNLCHGYGVTWRHTQHESDILYYKKRKP